MKELKKLIIHERSIKTNLIVDISNEFTNNFFDFCVAQMGVSISSVVTLVGRVNVITIWDQCGNTCVFCAQLIQVKGCCGHKCKSSHAFFEKRK